ncbi:orotidine-5'-phosphate decarboxylase [Candidatus Beckwithbacteria bacterium CG22_combo_CG10-13_8_21_14_all_01_47_9]|uniref:Orotidine-5'-phosphate decarboxylase n=3 Tax=Candidatus Beckwithiibacteriota TaxID=1752726 RepID=A0A2H0E168_9BACT|nr:MAG: orotidine-5'-phosphate decarboxylase [Candidatus Beckwithbacteria bacterium CG23_combo_of_CG06-09_8_20_14_all_47_9]PIP88173.1 MAG: orotidine-5'-phosphate decarboxylase [Candidatus Beckwithbacteria bacterium CG22_combo_CG10-13_8_21_14_all_01_47_9]PJA22792.1 MAG: orotidine-5'-phosphate decarboxylase [Candidatus Beckwithbacteria bacterium CG_4_10_14_0_2_um_filter_47_25]
MNFQEKLDNIVKKNNSLVCVGLDQGELEFNQKIIDQTHDLVCAYKPNFAFYEALGSKGWENLQKTVDYLRAKYPEVITIADAKRADIGNTNNGYVTAIFDELKFDAVTVNPYFGREALQLFLDQKDKGIILLCKTSNPGSGEFQDFVWEKVATNVAKNWNKNNNCLLVVGATYPEELAQIRKIVGEMTLLVPGIGTQGGDVAKTVKAGLNSTKAGMIINSSRGIIFSANSRAEALKLRDEINKYR